ncbi:MAG: 5/3-nucleotidase SurE [Pseudomonadota bacterium]|jgi:5'-nucleotidase
MRILLTNDDGYRAAGINELFKVLRDSNHDVVIVAPELNSSGAGQSITVYNPIKFTQVNDRVFYVDSTPADSVRMGLQLIYGAVDNYPELIISGINDGENISEDVFYSGTVGAAKEGALHGVSSIAVSTLSGNINLMHDAAKKVLDLITKIERNKLLINNAFLWNINIPNISYDQMGVFEVTALGKRALHKPMIKQITPRGMPIYWQGQVGEPEQTQSGTDVQVLFNTKNISITPLKLFPIDYSQMSVVSLLNN